MKNYMLKHKFYFAANLIGIILEAVFSVVLALMLKKIVDLALIKDMDRFKMTIMYSISIFIINYLVIYIRRIVQSRLIRKIVIELRQNIFESILKEDIMEFLQKNSSEYISVINNDLSILERDYFLGIFTITASVFSFLFAVITIIKLSIYIALGVFVTSTILIIIPQLYNKRLANYKKEYSNELSKVTIKLKDLLLGFEIIKCFNIGSSISKEFKNYNTQVENKKYRLSVFGGIIATVSSFFSFLIFFTAISIGTYLTIKNSISIGTMIASIQLMNNILNPISQITAGLNQLSSVKPIQQKINCILKYGDKQNNGRKDIYFKNNIEFKNVSVAFNNNYVLTDISFRLNKGSKIAIVGASGSGKSTILRTLLRYYEGFEGKILIDGVDIREVNTKELYDLITIIYQNVFLFDSSIKDNITLYQQYKEEQIAEVINLTGLKGFVEKLPSKEESFIGENASSISGGEKQRLAIARALIRKTPILLLDEINSALDNQTAYEIEDVIFQTKNLTAITVTHKLNMNTLKRYDIIIAIKDGSIVEKGTFDQLIQSEGYFYKLYSMQYKADKITKDIS